MFRYKAIFFVLIRFKEIAVEVCLHRRARNERSEIYDCQTNNNASLETRLVFELCFDERYVILMLSRTVGARRMCLTL